MKFMIIVGPQAVGKMTVGEKVAEQTGMKLFHNHMTIDLLLKVFSSWEDMAELNVLFREKIFTAFSKLDNEVGMIFTYLMDFASQDEWDYINHIRDIFKDHEFYFVELIADLETRLERNKTPNRLEKKWTKQNIKENEERMIETLKRHRTTSHVGEVKYKNYLRIENHNLSPDEVANTIITNFKL